MVSNTKRRGKANLPTRINFMGGHVDRLTGDHISRPYYAKKVVQFH